MGGISGRPVSSNSTPSDDASTSSPLNNGVYVFHQPEHVNITCDFVFFHGLHLLGNLEDVHVDTWRGGAEYDLFWPKQWLSLEFPEARMLTISYDGSLRKCDKNGRMDLFLVAENLIWELLDAGVGQSRSTIFVAHGFGGLVIKKICVEAHKRCWSSPRLRNFLENIRGIFYYSTPHMGMNGVEHIPSHFSSLMDKEGSLVRLAKELNEHAARLNDDFNALPFQWKQAGVGESRLTDLGYGLSRLLLVEEASSRDFRKDTNGFCVLPEDHFSICKHRTETSSAYKFLLDFVGRLDMDVFSPIPEDWQSLPPKLMGRLESPATIEEYVQEFEDGRVIGIWGMGGLGKTTAAKAFFNFLHSRFEFTLFAENVKFVRRGCNSDNDEFERKIFAKFHHRGRKLMEDKSNSVLLSVTGKKVLVVLDDVEEESELSIIRKLRDHRILDKSIFLVTSRDRHVLRGIDHVQLINLKLLDTSSSKRLLANYAIDEEEQEKVLEWKIESVGEISEHCRCLPLSLEVLGKYLRRKPVDVWEETMKVLKEKDDSLPEVERVRKVLRVSYDGLDPGEKEMFRDASTLFQEECFGWTVLDPWEKTQPTLGDAKAVWSVKYRNLSKRYWRTLVDRALVYDVPEDSPIQLHEHLRDLGESLSKQEGEVVVVYEEDEMDIPPDTQRLRTPEMWQKIRFVNSEITVPRHFWYTTEGEWRLSNLEYLWVVHCGVDAERVVLPSTLLVFGYRGSAQNLCLANCKRLVFLMLRIEEVERLPFSFEPFANLVRLSLYSSTIRFLPEEGMARMRALQELRIQCRRLQKLPESFGSLCQLHIFVLEDCNELKTLPESFGSLDHLHTLEIEDCHKLEVLPESFGTLARLHTLQIRNCDKLGAFPESFGNLSLLRSLTIWGGKFWALPESFGSLKGLESLSIGRCDKLVTLPIGSLTALQRIRMSLSSVRRLPETFGDLQSLRFLEVKHCASLETLPDSFGGLHQLMTLSLVGLKSIQTLPATFGNLRSLQTLVIQDCPNLKVLPDFFGSVEQLRTLLLWDCDGLQAIPDTRGRLQCLERLDIVFCGMLETLPDSLVSLRALQRLSICNCDRFQALPDTIGHLSRLESLYIDKCDRLKTLPPSLVNLRHVECEGYERVVQNYGIQEEE